MASRHGFGLFLRDLLHNQQEIYEGCGDGGHIGDDGDDLSIQFVQELLQFHLITGHAQIELMYAVFHETLHWFSKDC